MRARIRGARIRGHPSFSLGEDKGTSIFFVDEDKGTIIFTI